MRNEDIALKKLVEGFQRDLPKGKYTVKSEVRIQTGTISIIADAVIYEYQSIYAIIEIKLGELSETALNDAKEHIRYSVSESGARFGILFINHVFYLFDIGAQDKGFIELSFFAVISCLTKPKAIIITKEQRETVVKCLWESLKNNLPRNEKIKRLIYNRFDKSLIEFDKKTNSFRFLFDGKLGDSFEFMLFDSLVDKVEDTRICRYTTLDSLYSMLTKLTFRACGVMGMNDKSEVDFAERYLSHPKGLSKIIHGNKVHSLNNRYIVSCTKYDNRDDLTMWRLYADDARGVCIVLNVNNTLNDPNLLLRKVKYPNDKGRFPELDFLKDFMENVYRQTGYRFRYWQLGTWKHFFKPKCFSVEDEIRLLIIDEDLKPDNEKDWVLTYSHSIINPVIDFLLNIPEFPLKLTSIVLGPKCPEVDTNLLQIKDLIRRKRMMLKQDRQEYQNIDRIKVYKSNIENYR